MSIFNGNSYSNVNIGTAANSGDGDALRTAFEKTNNNFFDIYTFLGNSTHLGNVTNINIKGGTITGITDLALADGGTGASTATAARTNLGLVIGTNVQAWDSALDVISTVTPAADRIVYYTGTSSASGTALTAYARTLLDDTDAANVRTTLGLGNAALLNDGLFVVKDSNVTANLTVGNITILNGLVATSGYVSGNLVVGGNINLAGNITVGNIIVTGSTTTVGSQNITGNVNVYNIIAENAPQAGGSAVVSVQGRFSGNVTAGNITATRGTFTQVTLPVTGVSATTYGGTSKVPVFTVGTDGRITSAANVNVAGVTSFSSNNRFYIIQTADGSSFTANIPNVAVTADTYGGASKVPVITIDQQGRVTSAANVNVAGVTSFSSNNRFFVISTADGNSFTANIPNVSVTADTYGGASKVPVLTIDQQGRVTSAANVNVAGVTAFTSNTRYFIINTADGNSFSANSGIYSESIQNVTSASTTIDLDMANSGVFLCVINSNKTFTFSNPPSGTVGSFSLITVNSHNGNTISWPATTHWAGGASNIPPRTSNINAVDVWTFFTYNSGTSYIGTLASKDAKA